MTVEERPQERVEIWSPSTSLSDRVTRLRDHFYSFHERELTNEPYSFTTGSEWDEVYSYHDWANEPAIYPFFPSIDATLKAMAVEVELPKDFWKKTLEMRRAVFFHEVMIRYMPVSIIDGELIVGFNFNTALSRCLNKTEIKQRNKEMARWFKEASRLNNVGVGTAASVPGHVIPNYEKVLAKGFKGLVQEYEELKDTSLSDEHREFIDALILSCKTARDLAQRYSRKASDLASDEQNPERRRELEEIAQICRNVPWEPPETFWQALQSLWFTHMLVMAAESYPGAGLSFGRWDQYMYPFYKKDIESGTITRDWAKELLHCYWIKHNYVYDYQGRLGINQGINSSFGQLMTLSGCGPSGEDLTNDLTWLALEVIEEINLLEPKPNVRIHGNTPDDFMYRIAEILSEVQGFSFFTNSPMASISASSSSETFSLEEDLAMHRHLHP